MCGVVGIASVQPLFERKWLAKARDTLSHRGPDGKGEWWSDDKTIGLAHRRLSIFDLTSAADQPMHDPSSRFVIVFNGEIYNFPELKAELKSFGLEFRTKGDTEVVLMAYLYWGQECVKKLNGAFVFAIYDKLKRKVFLARDRAGEKPLFYCYSGTQIKFSSELKAILINEEESPKIDLGALDCYLALGYVPGNQCIISSFSKLQPAHCLTFDLNSGSISICRYWSPPNYIPNEQISDEKDISYQLENLLAKAVERQLRADVPSGILLSGGLDSSLITALAAQRSEKKLLTFSVGFPNNKDFDESNYANLVAKHFNTDHVLLEAESNSAELLVTLSNQFDEPIVDSSMIPTFLISKLVKQHCSVALGGDGADELFCGYNHYQRYLIMEKMLKLLPDWIKREVSNYAQNSLPVGMKGRTYLQDFPTDFSSSLPIHVNGFFDVKTRENLLKGFSSYEGDYAQKIFNFRVPNCSDMIGRSTRMDFENYLAEDLLVKVDRASMANSLEIRAPMLDVDVVEFVFGTIPSSMKIHKGSKKWILKKIGKRVLPKNFELERKQGFSIPLATWLKSGSYRDLFYDVLFDRNCMFDKKTVQNIFREQERGRNNSERLFALTFFELWRQRYKASV